MASLRVTFPFISTNRKNLVRAAEHAPLLSKTGALRVQALGLALDQTLGLLKGNAEGLHAHRGSLLGLGALSSLVRAASGELLDLVLAVGDKAVRDENDVLGVESGDDVLPLLDLEAVLAERSLGLVVHVLLDGLEELGDLGGELGDGDGALLAGVAAGVRDDVLGGVLGTELDAEGNTLELPVVELPGGSVALTSVDVGADTGLLEGGEELVNLLHVCVLLLGRHLGGEADGDEDGLDLGDTRREDETLVVTVDHDHDTDDTGGQTPRVLPDVDVLALLGGILDGDVEHLGEVLAQAVRGGTLDTTAVGRNVALDGGGVVTTGELLGLGLATTDDGDGEELLVDASVELENLENLLAGGLLGKVGGVTLLPHELPGTEERSGLLGLPTDDRVPLVQTEGKVAMAANPLGVV